MDNDAITAAYQNLCDHWSSLSQEDKSILLDRFKVKYSFDSGHMENPAITYHDTAEIFDKNGISNFSGNVRTIYEINNLKHAWSWLLKMLHSKALFDSAALLDVHRVLTAGTYDEDRWSKGERPGTFKRADYRVADDVGFAPEEVGAAVEDLLDEIAQAMAAPNARKNALTIAAYAHAKLVDIHPFADGNGRVARLLMNYVFLALEQPPCSISVDDRMAYFGALDAFHESQKLEPFKTFLQVQSIKTWQE